MRFKQFLEESIRFDTDSYMASHGKKPSGKGNWGFEVKGEQIWVKGMKSYVDAKKEIQKKYGKDKNIFSVKVLP